MVAVCTMSMASGVSAGVISLGSQSCTKNWSVERDYASGNITSADRKVFQIAARLLEDGVETVLPGATVNLQANLSDGSTRTYSMNSVAPYYGDSPPTSTISSYWMTYVDVEMELVSADWTITASNDGISAAPISISSWADAVANLSPGLDPFSVVPPPEYTSLAVTSSGLSLSWEPSANLGAYAGSPTRYRTALSRGGGGIFDGGQFVARASLPVSTTSYEYPIALAEGTYNLNVNMEDRFGWYNDTYYMNRGRSGSVLRPCTRTHHNGITALGLIEQD